MNQNVKNILVGFLGALLLVLCYLAYVDHKRITATCQYFYGLKLNKDGPTFNCW